MKKIVNPYVEEHQTMGYNCFGCCPDNPIGLHMDFFVDGEDVVSYWEPNGNYQGWLNTLHGGIQATMVDEVCGWLVSYKMQRAAMTTQLNMHYKKPVPTNKGKIEIRASIREIKRTFVFMDAKIICQGEVCAEGDVTYFCFSEEKSKNDMHYKHVDVVEE